MPCATDSKVSVGDLGLARQELVARQAARAPSTDSRSKTADQRYQETFHMSIEGNRCAVKGVGSSVFLGRGFYTKT